MRDVTLLSAVSVAAAVGVAVSWWLGFPLALRLLPAALAVTQISRQVAPSLSSHGFLVTCWLFTTGTLELLGTPPTDSAVVATVFVGVFMIVAWIRKRSAGSSAQKRDQKKLK